MDRTDNRGSEATARYDPEADAIAVRFAPEAARHAESEEVAPGVVLDYDAEGRVIGVEWLFVRDLMKAGQTTATRQAAAAR